MKMHFVVYAVTAFKNEVDGEIIVVTVTDETRELQGVETIVVRDTVFDGPGVDQDDSPTGELIKLEMP